ncbi:ABC transporter permease subunit [Pseudobacter ginsenosidimutans]|uniref:ABC-2 type transport system permease protein n=1 Tax=Pseudobacter ginsenosidimutans TaxID=661488 RepID=A0A4Q7N1W4_9BACT|nr:Gldg family protein [Pseudobacter ginsenosidimutans]QEC43802.1 ABC transporter permease subunit [Pseudobacter ginsenosidimutans]RZS75222.1 ABC-2 type transport system permease protein [Pseudobacter ginsenosidimutans]
MKIIFSIAKNEFRNLFYSPIAWFVLLIFFISCAHSYTNTIHYLANIQEVQLKNAPSFKALHTFYGLTADVFLLGGFFTSISGNLFLIIPLLTMGLISRDYLMGTSALLYSSPISIRKVVLGKYLGIMLYNMILVLIVAIFLVTGMMNIKQVDSSALLSALLGFYLLVCAYSAIGLFLSSLSQSQIVSAIATFLTIWALIYIGSLWQRYDFVRDLTWFLSMQGRADKMLNGLITTRDLFYFILVPGMFVVFTCFRLSGKLQYRPWHIKAGRTLLTLVVVLLLGYISSRPALTGYLDATSTQRNTLHPKTQQLLKELGDSTLEVTMYSNLLGKQNDLIYGMPESRNSNYLGQFWDMYLRFKPDISFKYVYYYAYDTIADPQSLTKLFPHKSVEAIVKEMCKMSGRSEDMYLPVNKVQADINLAAEQEKLVMQLKFKGHTAVLRTFDDNNFWPDETNVMAAIKRVQGTPMPSVAFSTGSLERNIYKWGDREYATHTTSKQHRKSMINIGFDVDTINLHTQSIPDKLTTLVIADPKMDLSPVVTEKINQYIAKGGNCMFYGEPGKQHVLNPLLAPLGMQLEPGQLVYPTQDETPDKVYALVSASSRTLAEPIANLNDYALLPGVTAVTSLQPAGWKIDSLANTIPNATWLSRGTIVIDSILPPFNAAAGDLKQQSFSVIKNLTRTINGKEQRLVISGDADLASNRRLSNNNTFLTSIYSWMAYNLFPLVATRKEPEDVLLKIGEHAAYYQKKIMFWVVPAILLSIGAIVLIRRKRK